MRCWALLAVMAVMVGCQSTREISRHTLDKLYFDTVMASPGVLSSVPKHIDAQASPTVVNWWYAGTSGGGHIVVYRELTWDANRKPIGTEKRYRIGQDSLTIGQPFAYVKDASRWLPLYDAAPGAFAPPADLPTVRQTPEPISNDPIRLPENPVLPPSD